MDPFRERIEHLLRQGKISPEEANKLLKALDNTGDTTSAPITGSGAPVPPPPARPTPTPPPPPVSSQPVTPPPPPPQPSSSPPPPPVAAPSAPSEVRLEEGVAKLTLSVTAGDVDVRGVPGARGIHAKTNNGTLEVIRDSDGVRIVAHGRVEDPTEIGWLNTVLRTIGRNLPVNLHVEVPTDLAQLEVKALAGDVDVRGVRGRVRLDLQAGDLKLEDASSFEINAKAGDIKVSTTLTDGDSRISALAGDVDVRLQPGSSVSLTASTTAGDVSARGFVLTQTEKRVTGGSLEGRLGAGRARLACKLTAGDLDIEAVGGLNQ
jgi:hypothetical protein